MKRELRTAGQLQAMIQHRADALHQWAKLLGEMPGPKLVAGPIRPVRPDDQGRNWELASMQEGLEVVVDVRLFVDELRGRYALAEL